MNTAFVIAVSVVVSCRVVSAQAVQIPIVSQFGARTSVLVPDRGGAYLGGVKRAFDSRAQAGGLGPFRFGSSVGRDLSSSSVTSHVWIHDLHEMDQMLLDAADAGTVPDASDVAPVWSLAGEGRRRPDFVRSSSRYAAVGRESAGNGLSTTRWAERGPAVRENGGLSRSRQTVRLGSSSFTSGGKRETPGERVVTTARLPVSKSPTVSGARSYRLGQKAEADDRKGLAILHYRTAAQQGSEAARTRLAELGEKPVQAKKNLSRFLSIKR